MINAIMEMAERKLKKLNERKREELPLSELLIGMQCGGSDAFSGVTANPSAGYAADMLVKGGANDMIIDVASGVKKPYSDQYGFHNDMCIFNPAPIT